MAEACQVCIPDPVLTVPEVDGDAAGDARGCNDQPSPQLTAFPGKPADQDMAELIKNLPRRNTPPSSGTDNLDKGWAWIIMVAALFTHIICFGMTYATLGAFHVEFLKEFKKSNADTSWTGSIMLGVMLCSGPFISVLIDRFGACAVAVVGGFLASAGFFISAMATSLLHLYFSFGVLTGLGLGMSYLPCIVMLGRFFERRRAFAAGIAGSGSGMGTFVFAPLNQKLLATLGWRKAFLVLGAVELILLLCGATYLERKVPVRSALHGSKLDADDGSNATPVQAETPTSSLVIVGRPGTSRSMQSLRSSRTNGLDRDVVSVGSWKQSIGVRIGRSVLLQSPPNSPQPNSPILLDSFFGLSSSVVRNFKGSSIRNSFTENSSSHFSNIGTIPTIEITCASSPTSASAAIAVPLPSSDGADLSVGSWQQSVSVRAGLSNFLQSPIASPTFPSPLTCDAFPRENMSCLSVSSTQDVSLGRSTKECQNNLLTVDALNEFQEENRLYPQLDDVLDQPGAVSLSSIAARIHDEHDGLEDGVSDDQPKSSSVCLSTLATIAYLFRNRFFVFFCLSGFTLCAGYQLPYMYFKAFALSRDIDQDAAAFILAVMGITDMLGRLVVGFVFDRVMCVSHRLMAFIMSLVISGLLLAVMSTASNYPTLAMTAATYTLVAGSTDPLVPALLVEYVGLDTLCFSFGFVIEMQGIGFLVGPPLAGYVYSYIKNYSAVYVFGAIAITSSSFIVTLESLITKVTEWRQSRRQERTNMESPDSRTVQLPT